VVEGIGMVKSQKPVELQKGNENRGYI
jgi:hypothetical protein